MKFILISMKRLLSLALPLLILHSFSSGAQDLQQGGMVPKAGSSQTIANRTTTPPTSALAAQPAAAPVMAVPAIPAALGDDYILAPSDLIEVKVFQEDDLDSIMRISQEGAIVFPLIGKVKVGGMTPQAAAKVIQDLLAQDYLVNPHVNLIVTEYTKRQITVLGEVQKPGSYDLPDRVNIPLLQAIGMAGGYTRVADPSRITVKRKVGNQESVIRLNGKKLAGDRKSSSFEVLPGDVINVGESLF